MGDRGPTPPQTVGPFLHLALADPAWREAIPDGEAGRIRIGGVLSDGDGAPVPDGLVETWQVDGCFTRCATDDDGRWEVQTRKPPPAPSVDGRTQAPHLLVSVFARGLLHRVVTRIYFGDEDAANAADPVLAVIEPSRRHRLVARGDERRGYRYDIGLQGEDESVFFEC